MRTKDKSSTQKILKSLKTNGWYELKKNGGHRQFKHPTIPGKVTVPQRISKNIELSIQRQMGLR